MTVKSKTKTRTKTATDQDNLTGLTQAPLRDPAVTKTGPSAALAAAAKAGPAAAPRAAGPAPVSPMARWAGGLLVAVAVLLIVWAWRGPDSGSTSQPSLQAQKHVDQVINRHLIMTNQRIEMEQAKAKLENIHSLPKVGEQILPRWRPQQPGGVDHTVDRNELNAVRDLDQMPSLNNVSPGNQIQNELADGERQAQLDSAYREEYARRFIENARAAGYAIELDENFVVKSVKRIKSETNPSLFEGEGNVRH